MKRQIILLFVLILLLTGCSQIDANNKKQTAVTKQETEQLAVSFIEAESATIDNQDGFYLRFAVKQLSGEPLQAEDYSFSLQDVLKDKDGYEYQALLNERLLTDQAGDPLPSDTVHFRQFFTPRLSNNLSTLPVSFFINPTYYKRDVIFENISAKSENVHNNDLILERVNIDGKKLSLFLTDVHQVKGLEIALLQDGEVIYPVFSKTEYGKLSNSLTVDFEFAKTLPELFSLKVTRHRLQDIVVELPFNIPIYYPY